MLRIDFSSRGQYSLKGCGVLKGMNMLPSPDMGVTDPLLTETPQSVLAALWYFAGTPNSRRENAETFARSAFLPQPKITDFRPGPRFRSAKKTIVVLSDFHSVGLWHQPHTFYNNNAPKAAGETAAFGAILLKVRGAGMTSPPGCRGGAPAGNHFASMVSRHLTKNCVAFSS